MNKNLLIALVVFAAGGWYYYSGGVSRGAFENGVYSNAKNNFSLTFPAGWQKAAEEDITPANGFNIQVPSGTRPSLIVVAPAPHKAVIFLRESDHEAAGTKAFAMRAINALTDAGVMGTKYRERAAEGALLNVIRAEQALAEGGYMYVAFFPGADKAFMLVSLGEKGYAPELPEEFEKIALSARRL
ncbi:MAG: hypothetical protein A2X32_10145 [Elusimicrobia bacterium GWC2_64_44]|nr:MAG: hypothetical protein A2X32_10145 [Elusimicrobia bacterium GWC2_64_44]